MVLLNVVGTISLHLERSSSLWAFLLCDTPLPLPPAQLDRPILLSAVRTSPALPPGTLSVTEAASPCPCAQCFCVQSSLGAMLTPPQTPNSPRGSPVSVGLVVRGRQGELGQSLGSEHRLWRSMPAAAL